jgi:hypothetical protein
MTNCRPPNDNPAVLMLMLMMIMIAYLAGKFLPATPLKARRAQGERSIADILTILQLPLLLIMTILMTTNDRC